MKRRRSVQYTIRSVPAAVDKALRQQARNQNKSLNEVARNALARGAGINGNPVIHHDLDECIGTWEEDPGILAALQAQDEVDEEAWR